MLTIEEYISKRKNEDKLNEFNIGQRIENLRICVDYVFEYFNNYLDITEVEHQTALNTERLNKYRKQIQAYDKEVQDWLVSLYNDHGKYMHRNIGSLLDDNDIFLLNYTESEFRAESYDCYSSLVKKYPFFKNQTEMLYLFIKDYHRVKSSIPTQYTELPYFTQKLSDWVGQTQIKFSVNIIAFCYSYIDRFSNEYEKWSITHRKKSEYLHLPYDYDYKQKKNLFNIDSLYPKISNKPFIKGHKQDLELIMMYYYLHSIDSDEEYWNQYLNKIVS